MQKTQEPDLSAFYAARDYASVWALMKSTCSESLGVDFTDVTLLFPAGDSSGAIAVCNGQTLGSATSFALLREREAFQTASAQGTGCRLVDLQLADLLEVDASSFREKASGLGHRVLGIFREDEKFVAGALFQLAASSPSPEPAALDGLMPVLSALGSVAGRITDFEILRQRNEALLQTEQACQPLFQAETRVALLGRVAEILDRQFGFSRIVIDLFQESSRTLRCELHSGFEDSFQTPDPIRVDPPGSYYAKLFENGQVVYLRRTEDIAEELTLLLGSAKIERGLLAPLQVGAEPQGLIYADHPRNEVAFVYPEVFDSFVRTCSSAFENLKRLLYAETRAETDPLTGVYNRYYLDRVLEMEVPRVRRYKSPISLLMLDLCDFKQVNDTYGHVFGDYILKETANLIRTNVRRPDIVVRYGGDEFVVLMVNTDQKHAKLVQNRIEQAILERNRLQDDEKMMIDISIGLRSADEHTIEDLLEDADRSMYGHKAERKRGQMVHALLGIGRQNADVIDKVVSSLLTNLDKREPFNQAHRCRVAHLALLLAKELSLDRPQIDWIVLAAVLHDVGKASLPSEILQRPGPLTDAEYRAVQGHPEIGEEFLQGLGHLDQVCLLIRHHHERFDGKTTGEFPGYPVGMAGEAIPLGARILKLADSFDAIISDRPYRVARSIDEGLEIVKRESGASFDPDLVKILLANRAEIERLGNKRFLAHLYENIGGNGK